MDTSDVSYFVTSVVAVCATLAFLGIIVVLWRAFSSMERMSGGARLSLDRERHDLHRLVTQMAEKLYAPGSFELAKVHAQERAQQSQLDAALERERHETIRAVQDVRPAEQQYLAPDQEYEGVME